MYIEQAYKGKYDWWRYLFTFIIFFFTQYFTLVIPVKIYARLQGISEELVTEFFNTLNPEKMGLSLNEGLIFLLLPMSATFFTLSLSMRYIHELPWRTIFTSFKSFRWKNFFTGLLMWTVVLLSIELINYLIDPGIYEFTYHPKQFFPLLFIALVLVPFQAGAEELLCRGNLLQAFGLLSRSRFLALIITAAIFGFMHFSNPEVDSFGFWKSMSYYIGFGLFMGILTIMDGGLELPIAVHTANNLHGIVLVSYNGSVLNTDALFRLSEYNLSAMIVAFFFSTLLFLIVSKRLFRWKSFDALFKKVQAPNSN
jgi:membrane protease YdiL (CAAX protease family)